MKSVFLGCVILLLRGGDYSSTLREMMLKT